MSKLSTTVAATTTTKTEVKLSPAIRRQLTKLGDAWEVANAVEKKAVADKDAARNAVDKVLSDAGEFRALEEGIEIGRFKMKYTSGERTFLDEEKLRVFLTPAQIEECRTTTSTKASVRITAGKA